MTIAIVDVWNAATPPRGASTDDGLLRFAAAWNGPAVVIGDAGAPDRAEDFGITPVAHVAVSPRLASLGHRRLARLLDDLGRPDCIIASPFARSFGVRSGAIEVRLRSEPSGSSLPASASRPAAARIVPIADHPTSIPAARLVTAAGLLQSAGETIEVLLPRTADGFRVARARAASVDRRVRVRAIDSPAFQHITNASCVVSFGAEPAGPQAKIAARAGLAVVEGRDRLSPLSLAIALREALRDARLRSPA